MISNLSLHFFTISLKNKTSSCCCRRHRRLISFLNMPNLSYSVTESIRRDQGQIIELIYSYEESQVQSELNLLTQKHDHTRNFRKYQATVKRDEYERMVRTFMHGKDKLTFDDFIRILRPIMMGTYANNELQEAFELLDRDQSGLIDIDELADFLPILHSDITREKLLNYVGKIDINTDQKLNFDEFTDMILRGIGRDIVCRHI
jgi:Ca2+-binding EF-hand superfamily protein